MKCSVCGTELPSDAKFCSKCGNNVSEQEQATTNTMYCYNCGKPVDPKIQYCLNCGVKLNQEEDTYKPKKVGFVEAYQRYWKNYVNFSGRATVAEYWFVVVWNLIIGFATSALQKISGYTAWYDSLLEFITFGGEFPPIAPFAIIAAIIVYMWELANLLPGLALTVRRLHDVGKSGWYILMLLIPIVGWIFLLVALVKKSQPGRNQYDD